MDNELFKLCKEVHKLFPDWNTGQWIDYHEGKFTIYGVSDNRYGEYVCPLFNSDYLLEKLKPISDEHPSNQLLVFTDTQGWCAKMVFNFTDDNDLYHFHETTNGFGYDTPLKALLKLVLALKEAGEL